MFKLCDYFADCYAIFGNSFKLYELFDLRQIKYLIYFKCIQIIFAINSIQRADVRLIQSHWSNKNVLFKSDYSAYLKAATTVYSHSGMLWLDKGETEEKLCVLYVGDHCSVYCSHVNQINRIYFSCCRCTHSHTYTHWHSLQEPYMRFMLFSFLCFVPLVLFSCSLGKNVMNLLALRTSHAHVFMSKRLWKKCLFLFNYIGSVSFFGFWTKSFTSRCIHHLVGCVVFLLGPRVAFVLSFARFLFLFYIEFLVLFN